MVGPQFRHRDVVVAAEAAHGVERLWRDIEVERHAQTAERHPLGQGLEGIDRFTRLHFDDGLELAGLVVAEQDQVGHELECAEHDRRGRLPVDVRHGVVLALVPRQKQSDDAVVLELFAHGPDEDGHDASALGAN